MIGAILLAGGRSLRMGKDKAGLLIEGRTLLERTITLLHPLVEQTVVMLADRQDISYLPGRVYRSITIGRDKKAQQGPLQGIGDGTALLNREIVNVFVLTCDLPYLNFGWLQKMQDCLQEKTDIVCSVNGKIVNPLIALYRRRVLERADQLIKQGNRRPIDLWQGFRVEHLVPTKEERYIITEVNTPEEYQAAIDHFTNL